MHYIDNLNDKFSASAKFLSMLVASIPQEDEVRILSGSPSRKVVLKALYELKPHVVHIHTCWNYHAAMVQQLCQSRGYDVLLMPHGQLMPNQIQTDFWKHKLPRILLYQMKAVRKSTVLIASTTKELDALKELGWRKRIALVRNPYAIDEQQTTTADSVNTLRTLYKKVVDTHDILKLTRHEEYYFSYILHAAMFINNGLKPGDSPELSVAKDDFMSECLTHISALEWYNLILAAQDRGVHDEFLHGAKSLKLCPPYETIDTPVRFVSKLPYKIRVNGKAANKFQKNFPQADENLNVEKTLSLLLNELFRRLVLRQAESDKFRLWPKLLECFTILRFKDVDEAAFIEMLKTIKIFDFSRRIIQILNEMLFLSEGFMPFEPLNDRNTDKLRKLIYTQP